MKTSNVRRTASWVHREYGRDKWPAVERLIADVLASGESDLNRVVEIVSRRAYAQHGSLLDERTAVFCGHELCLPLSMTLGAYHALIAETVIAECDAETALIVELGAGWGHNLLEIYLRGGPSRATFIAAELTASGRRAAARLAALQPDLDLRTAAFDFGDPVLNDLPRAGRAVVFTSHAIEQVPAVSGALFDAIRSLAPAVTCLHFEPFGWQLPARSDDDERRREYAEQHDYNRNFIEVINDEVQHGRIDLHRTMPNLVGANPLNPTSLLVWSTGHAD